MKTIQVGILGIGTVGGGTYYSLVKNHDIIQKRTGLDIKVVRGFGRREKSEVPVALRTKDPYEIIDAPNIDIVAEALSGAEPATEFMIKAMRNGKHVVTSNKAAIAANYPKLRDIARENGVQLLFEASVGSAIPILSVIDAPLLGNNFLEIKGILNGTTNYILTKMEEGAEYADALADAQAKGFAEAEPTADVEGFDAANKLSILIARAFDTYIPPSAIPTTGITAITKADIKEASAQGLKIKLVAHASINPDGSIEAHIAPEKLPLHHPLSGVYNEFNAIYVRGDIAGELMFYGPGAGALPAASAVVGDIIAVATKAL